MTASQAAAVAKEDRVEQVELWQGFSQAHIADDCPSTSAFHGEASTMGDAKVRKPYTITKQRERWTEEEHQKFMDALKLYGRAWRRIEEHVGTKTAVQIRSHAQKFFSKLEREASSGVSTELSDIHIPPPRPKRKPTHPYPRKANVLFSSISSTDRECTSSLTTPSAPFVIAVGPSSVDLCLKATPSQVVPERQLPQLTSTGFEFSRECGRHVDDMQSTWNVPQISKTVALDSTMEDAALSSCRKRSNEAVEHDDCLIDVKVESLKKVPMTKSDEPAFSIEGTRPAHQFGGESMNDENIPLQKYGQKLLTAVHELVSPFHPPIQPESTDLSPNAPLDHFTAGNTLLNSQSPTQAVSLNGMYASPSIVTHAGWGHSFTPWQLMHVAPYDDPTVVATAAAAAATAAIWPGHAFGAPLHLPIRPSFNFEGPNIPVSTNGAAAAAAAAAASFAAASTWWALNGAIAHAITVPEMRVRALNGAVAHALNVPEMIVRANPAVYPDAIAGLQPECIHLSHEFNGGDHASKSPSFEQEDSTVNASQEADIHFSPPKLNDTTFVVRDQENHNPPELQDSTIIEECSRPSFGTSEVECVKKQKEVRDQKKPSNNSTMGGISCSGSKGVKKQYAIDGSSFLCCKELESESENSGGVTLCVLGASNNPSRTCVVQEGERCPSCNSPECRSRPSRVPAAQSALEQCGEDHQLNKGESTSVLDNLSKTFPLSVMCNVPQEHPVSALQVQDDKLISQGAKDGPVICKEEGASESIPSHARREVNKEVSSLRSRQTECISSCGLVDAKKSPADAPADRVSDIRYHACQSPETNSMQAHTSKCHLKEDCNVDSLQKVDIYVCEKVWEWEGKPSGIPAATPGEVETIQSTCVGNKQDSERAEETGSQINVSLVNEREHQIHDFKAHGIFPSAASNAGSNRYSGLGFVPYRRSSTDAGAISTLKSRGLCIEEKQSSY